MLEPPQPVDELDRLNALRALQILDTEAEERFDRLTRLAKRLFDVPIALVSLVDSDRQWFKSAQGLKARETPRAISFCGHAIVDREILVIPDATADPRFYDNPLVSGDPNIRFYAGCPLTSEDGHQVGTLCVIDRKPRTLNDDDLQLMADLARLVEHEFATTTRATMDPLTGISNRRGFEILSRHALGFCARLDAPASLMCFDLDGFNQINTDFGHAGGDRALRDFSRLLQQSFCEFDVIGRLGGDKFAVLLTSAKSDELLGSLLRLKQNVKSFNAESDRNYILEYSVGAVKYNADKHDSPAQMLAVADTLMCEQKQMKRESRDCVAG